MAANSRFTRIPKVHDLVTAGVPTEVIPTYCALADHANNATGICWPRMDTLARRLSRSPRTIQRHLRLLKERGLVEFVERRRDWKGRFGAYVYRIVHIVAVTARAQKERADRRTRGQGSKKRPTTGHGDRVAPNRGRTKRQEVTPLTPQKDPVLGYWALFGEDPPPGAEDEHRKEMQRRREEKARRRREGYEWFLE